VYARHALTSKKNEKGWSGASTETLLGGDAPSSATIPAGYLLVRRGTDTSLIEVTARGVVLGRAPECDVPIDDGGVSRRHASIEKREGRWVVEDLGSRNGTSVNGEIVKGATRALEAGDVVRIARTEIVLATLSPLERATDPAEGRAARQFATTSSQHGGRAAIVRVVAPRGRNLSELRGLLDGAGVVESRTETEWILVPFDPATEAVSSLVERLRSTAPEFTIDAASAPEDGASFHALWIRLHAATREAPTIAGVVVADAEMRRIYEFADRLAKVDTTVLILGETGVGKDVLARHVHTQGARKEGPFVRLNCASLPETLLESELFGHERGAFTGADRRKTGYFEAAHRGTLFLDEVGELPASAQVKLLNVLETRAIVRIGGTQEVPVDVRVLCATHRDLVKEVEKGRFREDLFYRISTVKLRIPAIRERPSEVRLLSNVFGAQFAERMGFRPPAFSEAAMEALVRFAWPGNVRQLRNAIEHAVLLSDGKTIEIAHLPSELVDVAAPSEAKGDASASVRSSVETFERDQLRAALEAEKWNQTRAAQRLGLSRRALIYKMQKYDLHKPSRS